MNEQTTRSLDDVLAGIAIPGCDPVAVTDYAMGLISRRTRRMRVVGGGATMILVAATTVVAVTGNNDTDTDEVVTPAESTTSTTAPTRSENGSSTRIPSSTAPAPTVAVTTLPTTTHPGPAPAPPVVLQPPPTVTATTAVTVPPSIAVDQPGSGTLSVSPGAAGQLLNLVFEFDDPDGPGGNPSIAVATDEPGTPPLPEDMTGPKGGCEGGPGTRVRFRDRVQFASTGNRVVRIALKYCSGPARVFNTTVQVGSPQFGDGAGWAVMAEVPDPAPPLERSRWEFHADDGRVVGLVQPVGSVLHDLGTNGGVPVRGVVIVLPVGTRAEPTTGSLVLISDAGRYAGRVASQPAPGDPAMRVRLVLSDPSG